MASQQEIEQAIAKVEHPEIAMSLVDLGMIKDVKVEGDDVTFTLMVPFLGIPEVIRNYMINSVAKAVEDAGARVTEVSVEAMSDEAREAFFGKEKSHWKM